MYIYIIIIILLIGLSAFFSGSEAAFNGCNRMRLKKSAEGGKKTAKLASNMLDKFDPYLSTIMLMNNIVNIATSSVATILIIALLSKTLWTQEQIDTVASLISTFGVTLIVLVFGEILPKIICKNNADKLICIYAVVIKIFSIIFYPIVAVFLLIIKLVRPIWGKDREEDAPTVTEEELSSIIDTVEEEGVIDEEQSELLQSTLDFSDTTVLEIMTPRIDTVFIDIEDEPEEIKEVIENSPYSRIPVFEEGIDDIIGVLYVNKYYKAMLSDKDGKIPDIRSILFPVCFIHKTMKLPVALNMMREKKSHLAVVIDEFGGTLGIVTMEDILEELVGDIWDESDEIINEIVQTGESTYEISGDMNIDSFFEEIEFHPSSDFECEYSTVGGWAVEMLQADPHLGDSFEYENLYLVVSEMDDMRVTKLMLLIKPAPDDEEE